MATKAEIKFLKDKFWFAGLKKAGVYPKSMKFNDYDGQIKRQCELWGINSIFDYERLIAIRRPARPEDFLPFTANPIIDSSGKLLLPDLN